MTDRSDLHELVALHALDALEPDEVRTIEVALERDPDLRRQLDEFRSVTAILAEAIETAPSTPSTSVWANIESAIGGTGVERAPLAFAPARALRRQRWFARVATAVSVAAIAVSVALAVQVFRLSDEDPTDRAIQALVDDPASEVVTLLDPAGAATEASVVLGATGVGYVYADTLPALPSDRTYQLWAIVDEGEPAVISAGVLGADPDRAPFQVVGVVTGFAITEEQAGGVVTSANDPVAVWLRDA